MFSREIVEGSMFARVMQNQNNDCESEATLVQSLQTMVNKVDMFGGRNVTNFLWIYMSSTILNGAKSYKWLQNSYEIVVLEVHKN